MTDLVLRSMVPAPAGWRWCAVIVCGPPDPIAFEYRSVPAFALCRHRGDGGETADGDVLVPFAVDPDLRHAAVLASLSPDADTETGFLVDPRWTDGEVYPCIEEAVRRLQARQQARAGREWTAR